MSRVLLILVGGSLVAGTLLAGFDRLEFRGFGEGEVCVETSNGISIGGPSVEYGEPASRSPESTYISLQGLSPDADLRVTEVTVCDTTPGAGERVALGLRELAAPLSVCGFLVLVRVVIRRARCAGLFSLDVARMTRWLGWYLVVSSVVVPVVRAGAEVALLNVIAPGRWDAGFGEWLDLSFPALLAGIGVLTIARVLRLAVDMREDLDATI